MTSPPGFGCLLATGIEAAAFVPWRGLAGFIGLQLQSRPIGVSVSGQFMTPAVELVYFATRYKLRTGKLPTAMPATDDEVRLFLNPNAEIPPAPFTRVPQFMGIDLYPCPDALQRRQSLK